MANNTSTFTLKLKTEGMDQAQAGSKQIRENLEGAQRAASSTKIARSAAAQPTGMAGASAGIGGREVEDYNRASGTAGKAGGTARDFADQARGLGGLVRLYATVAANAFAAAAAFGALSRAMDTTNMVKGLDQLGASSGVALGSLSKRLVAATDGAVSLREAMEATVKASSAGLDTNQILQLGDVSKKAAQALGLNMTDALSRLTRGITKLEPELLDELGIFVKIDDATSKYALSVGKSTSALTDFERRQAFANAVLEQGKKKFDEIKIDSNPYTKLAASFQNLTQSILEFVNKGLTPVAKFLSENTTILAAVFAFVALKLTQAALPALGQWQEGLVKAAQTAKASAREINTSFGEAFVQRWTEKLRIPELEKQVEQGKKSLQSLASAVDLQGMGRGKAALGRILAGGTEAKDIKTINTLLGEQTKKYEEALEANNKRQNATTRGLQAEISFYQTAIERSKALAASTRELTEANKQFNKSAIEAPSAGLGERAREMTVKSADRKAQMYSALADVSTNVLQEGVGSALKKLNTQLNVEGVGYIRRFTGLAIGAFSAVTTSIGIFANAISGYLAVFTFLITLGAGILNFFSNTKKESEATSEAFGRLEGGLKTTRDTLERISMMKDPLEQISVESIQAKANALKELGDAAVLTQTRAFDEISKMNSGDEIINWFKGFLDADVQTKLASNITESITQALKLAQEGPAKEQAKKTLEAILGADVNASNLGKRVSTLVQTGDREKIAKVTDAIQQLGFQSSVSAAKGTEFKESIKKLTTDIQEFNKSLTPTDAISKFAQDGIETAQKLKLALDDPTQSLQAMIAASNDVNLLAIFPPDVAAVLMSYNKELQETAKNLERVGTLSAKDAKNLKELYKELETGVNKNVEPIKYESILSQIREIEAKPLQLQAEITAKNIDPIKAAFDGAVRASLVKSSEMMGARIASEVNKAQTVVLSTLAGMIGDTEVGIRLRTEIELKGIDASNAVARESAALAMEVDKLRIQMERRNLLDEKKEIKSPGDYTDRERQIDARLEQLKKTESVYMEGPGKLTSKSLRGELSGGKDVSADLLQAVQKFESLNAAGASAAAQKESVRVKERIDLLVAAQKKEMEILDIKIKQGSLSISTLNTQREMGLISDEEYTRKSNTLALEQISNDFDKKKQAAADEYNKLSAIGTELFKIGKVEAANELEILAKRKKLQTDKLTEQEKEVALQEQQSRNAKFLIEIEQKKFDKTTKEIEFRDSLLKVEDDLAKTKLDSNRQEIEYLANTDRVSKEYAANRIAEIARESQALALQGQIREVAAQRDVAIRAALFKATEQEIKSGGQDDGAAMIAANKEIERANQLYAVRTAALEGANTSATRAIEITRQQSLETAKQNEELKKQAEYLQLFTNISDTLSSAFGKTGQVLNTFVSALGDSVKTQLEYNTAREKLLKVESDFKAKQQSGEEITSEDVARRAKAEKDLGKLNEKNARDEMVNNTKLVGSVKNMFKEKTAAYKIFNAFERAMHVYTLTMDIAKIASGWMVTNQKVAQDQIQTASKAAPAGASAAAETPGPVWTKLAAGLAAFAFVMSLAQGGKGTAAPAPGTSSVDRQETQGTGMSWVDGKKVETGGGVFGDAEAKTDPIRKSLEKISETSVDGVFENRKMVSLLQSIDRSIGNAAKGLYSIPGLRTGSAFGTIEGTNSGGGLLGTGLFASKTTKTISDSGLVIQGTFRELAGEISGGVVQLYQDVVTTTKKWWGKTSSSIKREVEDLPEALSYINEVFSYSGDLFVDLGDKLSVGKDEVWKSLDALGKLDFEGSLRNLKGDDLNKELQAIIGSQLDKAAISVFGSLIDKFKEFGESALETVVRIVDETEKGLQALGNISIANGKLFRDQLKEQLALQKVTQTVTQTAGAGPVNIGQPLSQEDLTRMWQTGELFFNYATLQVERRLTNLAETITGTIVRPITDAEVAIKEAEIIQNLSKLFGDTEEGFDKFLGSIEYFRENFLTEAERLAPVREMVETELAKLGLGFVDTRDEFKGVVQSLLDVKNPLGVMTEGGQKLLSTLLLLAPAFDEVYKAAEPALMSVEEFAKKVMGNEVDILKTQASILEKNKDYQGAYTKLQESLLITRKAELTELEKLPEAQRSVLIQQAQYKWSLEDLANETKFVEQINRELIDTYNGQITTLQKFVSYLDEALGLVVQAARLRGDSASMDLEGAKYIERTIKLQDISNKYAGEENRVRRQNIIGIQKYIWALEDEQEAKNKYIQAAKDYADAINRQITSLQSLVSYLDEALGMVVQAVRLRADSGALDLEAATNIERRIRLQDISNKYAGDENKQRRENIIGLQNYIWALEDEQSAKDKLTQAANDYADALDREAESLKGLVSYLDEALGMVIQAVRLRADPGASDLEAAKYLERRITLQDISNRYSGDENKVRRQNIIGLQEYIWALEDEEEARSNYLDAISKFSQAIQNNISEIESKVSYFDRVLGLIGQALQSRGSQLDILSNKNISRTIELQNIQKEFAGEENRTKRETITGLQNYLWALEDEKEAKDRYVEALNTQVEAAQKEISKLEEVIASYDKLLDQKARIAELESADSATAKLLGRERELANLRRGVTEDIATALVNNQNYIWALEDEQELKQKLIEQRDKEKQAIEETINSLEDAIKSLKDYSKSLLLDQSLTTLTPEQQYLEAKKSFEGVLATAQTAGTDEASRKAQLEAVQKLPEVSNKFLELSRTMFASSTGYTSDFNLVRQAVEQTSSGLEAQLTDAQLQLKQLEQSTQFLNSIEQSSKTTAELLVDYRLAQEKTAVAAEKASTLNTAEITALKKTAEDKITQLNIEIQDATILLEELTGKTLTYQEAQLASSQAQADYSAASMTALNSLGAIQGVISDQNIANILASRNEAVTQIGLLQSQLTALQNIEASVNKTMSYADAERAYKSAAATYGAAKDTTIAKAFSISSDINSSTINEAIDTRGETLTQINVLERQATSLRNIDTNLLTKTQAQTAFEDANKNYDNAVVKTLGVLAGISKDINSTTINEAISTREDTLSQISVYQKQLDALNSIDTKTPTLEQAEKLYKDAQTKYGSAKDASIAALAGISEDINGSTVNQAITARDIALTQIAERQALIQGLQKVETNTYGVYQSQQDHYKSLISTPQEVNVGKSVAALLARIALNTGTTADGLVEVKNAVNGSTEAVVTTNATATNVQTEVLTEAINNMATNWQQRTVPQILAGSGILA